MPRLLSSKSSGTRSASSSSSEQRHVGAVVEVADRPDQLLPEALAIAEPRRGQQLLALAEVVLPGHLGAIPPAVEQVADLLRQARSTSPPDWRGVGHDVDAAADGVLHQHVDGLAGNVVVAASGACTGAQALGVHADDAVGATPVGGEAALARGARGVVGAGADDFGLDLGHGLVRGAIGRDGGAQAMAGDGGAAHRLHPPKSACEKRPPRPPCGGLAVYRCLQDRDLLLHELQVGTLQTPVTKLHRLPAKDLGFGVKVELQAVLVGGRHM